MQILVHNAYILYKEFYNGRKMNNYDFHCKIIDHFIKKSCNKRNKSLADRASVISNGHYPYKSKIRSNCIFCRKKYNIRSSTSNKCTEVDVFLCIYDRFKEYHIEMCDTEDDDTTNE